LSILFSFHLKGNEKSTSLRKRAQKWLIISRDNPFSVFSRAKTTSDAREI